MQPAIKLTPLSQLRIRQASEEDLTLLEWEGEFTHFRRLFADAYHMAELGKGLIWISVAENGFLIGQLFVSLSGGRPELSDGKTRAYIYGFRIRPSFRRMGVGGMMMHTVEADLAGRDFQWITLNVANDNLPARRFYERFGYRVTASDPGIWSYLDDQGIRRNVHEPSWRMEKLLSNLDGVGMGRTEHPFDDFKR